MIYRTFKADDVASATNAVLNHILPNFDSRYGHMFTAPNCQNVRGILETDYDCPKDIIEKSMKQLGSMGVLEYTQDIWELL